MADKADVTGKSVQERLLDDLSSGPKRGRPRGGSDGGLDGQSPQKGAKRSSSGGRVRPAGKDLSALDGLVGARGAGAPSYPAASTLADPSARHFAGLSNQGATCYMNSLLQTLFMTPDFRDLMFRWRYSRAVDGPPDMCVPLQLQKLFAVLQSTRRRAIETKALTHSFGWSGSQAFEQHDVQELARVLLDALDETVHAGQQAAGAKADGAVAAATADEPATAAGGPGPAAAAAAAGPGGLRAPSSIFGGQLEEYVRCDECGNTRRRFADFQDLSLDVVPFGAERGFASIGESLASYCAPEVMDGSNKVQCDVCGRQTRTVKGSRVSKWPQYLVLQLKRFTIDMLSPTLQRVKLQDPVAFPFSLDARQLMAEAEEGRAAEAARIGGADGPAGAPPPAAAEEVDGDQGGGDGEPAAGAAASDNESGSAARASSADAEASGGEGPASRKAPPPPPRNHTVTPPPPPGQFELFAVLVHSGGALGGHYYAYVKDLESCRWFNFNDSSVSPIDEATVRSAYGTGKASYGASAYMLVYREVPEAERPPAQAADSKEEADAAAAAAAAALIAAGAPAAGGAADGASPGAASSSADQGASPGQGATAAHLAASGSASRPGPAAKVVRRSLFPDTSLLPPGLLRALESAEAEEKKAEEERARQARQARLSVHSFADEDTVVDVWIDREEGTVGELIRRALVGLGAAPDAPPAAPGGPGAGDGAAAGDGDGGADADGADHGPDEAAERPRELEGFLFIGGGGGDAAPKAGPTPASGDAPAGGDTAGGPGDAAASSAAAPGAEAEPAEAEPDEAELDPTVHWGMWRGVDLRLFRLRRYDVHAKLAREEFPDNAAPLSRARIYSYSHVVLERRASVREEWEEYNPLHVGLKVRQWSQESGACLPACTLRMSRSSSLGNLRGRVSEITGIPPASLRLLRCDAGIGSEPRAFELVGDAYPISRMGISTNVTIFAEDLRCEGVQAAISEAEAAWQASLLAVDEADEAAGPAGGAATSGRPGDATSLPASYGAAMPRSEVDHTELAEAPSTDDEGDAAPAGGIGGDEGSGTTPGEDAAASPSQQAGEAPAAGGSGVKLPPKGGIGRGTGVTLLPPRSRTGTTPGTTRSGLPVHDSFARRTKSSKLHDASQGPSSDPATAVVSGAASRRGTQPAHAPRVSTSTHPGPGGRGGDDPDAPAVSEVFTIPSGAGAVPVRLDSSPCVGVYEKELNTITVRVPLVLGEGRPPLPGRVAIDRRESQAALKLAIARHFGRDCIDGLVFRMHSAAGKILAAQLDNGRTIRDALIHDGNNIFVEEGSEELADRVDVPVTFWRPSFPLGTDWAGPPAVMTYEEALALVAPEGAPIAPCAPHFAPELPSPQEAEWARQEIARLATRSAALRRKEEREQKAQAAADTAAADKNGGKPEADKDGGKPEADKDGGKPDADKAAADKADADKAGAEPEAEDPEAIAADAALIADEWGPLGAPRNMEPHPDIGPATCVEAGTVKLSLAMDDVMVRELIGDRLRAIGALEPALQAVADGERSDDHSAQRQPATEPAASAKPVAAGAGDAPAPTEADAGAASDAEAVAASGAGEADAAAVAWLPADRRSAWAALGVSVFSQRIIFSETFGNRTLRYNAKLSSMTRHLSSYSPLLATPRRDCDFGNDALMALPAEPETGERKFECLFIRWVDRTRLRLLPPRQVVISRESHVLELGLRLERACGIPARYLQFSNTGTFLGLHNMDTLTWWRFTDKYRFAKMWVDTTCIVVTTTDDCPAFPPRYAPQSALRKFDPYAIKTAAEGGAATGTAAATPASVRTARPRQLDRGIKIQTHQQRQRIAGPAVQGGAADEAGGGDGADPAAAAAAAAEAAAAEEAAVYGLGDAAWSGASTAVSRPAAAIAMAAAAGAQERDRAKEDATRQRLRDEEAERDAAGGEEEVDGDAIPLDEDGEFDPFAMMGVE
ncbi:hypothetical protein FNF31_06914 [Cafeteria roenbergensis]|uniref:USP domain-containing protein n=1 Tax=Cafeteria roenbergensis TaxID=33653 RepID=A0A5A8CED8_CAFRO|nr:hypothetical protein FNF31_06914 [Cafeteria roenbergensis]